MGIVTIWERDPNLNLSPSLSLCSGNMFCIILCSHWVWNLSPSPNLNPSLAVEISHNYFSQIHLTYLHSGSGNAKGSFTLSISDQHCNDASNTAVIENNGVTLQ